MLQTVSVAYTAFNNKAPFALIGSQTERGHLLHKWMDCEENSEAVVEEICKRLCKEHYSSLFGTAKRVEVLIVIHSPAILVGGYIVELEQPRGWARVL